MQSWSEIGHTPAQCDHYGVAVNGMRLYTPPWNTPILPSLIYTLYNVYINKGRNWRVSDPHFLDFNPLVLWLCMVSTTLICSRELTPSFSSICFAHHSAPSTVFTHQSNHLNQSQKFLQLTSTPVSLVTSVFTITPSIFHPLISLCKIFNHTSQSCQFSFYNHAVNLSPSHFTL